MPIRIQLSRKKGWRIPPNTVKVDRSTKWGNPFVVGMPLSFGYFQRYRVVAPKTVEEAIALFRKELVRSLLASDESVDVLLELRGKNLGCWCRLCDAHKEGKPLGAVCNACAPCHVDVLLELANVPTDGSAG